MTESDNLPAVRELAPVTKVDTDSWVDVMRPILALAERISDTEFVPKGLRGSMPATAAAMLYGREVGLPPMTALNMTHVVEGKPGLSAEAMRALVLAAGHEIEFGDMTVARCQIRGRRRGSERWTTVTWSIDDARAAGLLGKNNWKGYPRRMLQARATTELCELVFPDVIHGFRSVEELQDEAEGPAPFGEPAAAPSATVTRAKRTRKTAGGSPPPVEKPTERPALTGPPLPGEPGYDDTTSTGTTEEPVDAELADEPTDEGAPADHGDTEAATGSSATTDTAPEGPGGDTEDASSEGGGDAAPAARGDGRAASPRKASRAQERMIFAELSQKFGVGSDDREERLYLCGRVLRRKLTSFTELSADDAKTLIETFGRLADRAALDGLLDTIDQAEEERADVERQDMAGEPEPDGAES